VFDILIRKAMVIDGAGNPWFKADIGVKDGKIERIGKIEKETADYIIDASGLVASPGFIDMHSHADLAILGFPKAENLIMQGVTTAVTGNCGISLAPLDSKTMSLLKKDVPAEFKMDWGWRSFSDFFQEVKKNGTAINIAPLVGHGTIRTAVMGFDDRVPTKEEMKKMANLLSQSMEAGAFGVSTGLIYPPGVYSKTPELIELAKVAAKYGGIYVSHIRGESEILIGLINAVKEAIEIGEKADIPVEISHHKASGEKNWGKVKKTLKIMEEAQTRGVEVTCDVYPYTAGSASLKSLLPPWALEGGTEKMIKRLRGSESRKRIENEFLKKGTPGWGEPEEILISHSALHKDFEGRTLGEIAKSKGENLHKVLIDLLLEEKGETGMVTFTMAEEDVSTVISSRLSMIGSDSEVCNPGAGGKPHPRTYGTFPRILGRYVREKKILTLEEAVRKMTSFPAQKIGLPNRGLLKEGMWADIVILDPQNVIDKASYMNPHQYPEGIEYVLVNGEIVVGDSKHTGRLSGKILKKHEA